MTILSKTTIAALGSSIMLLAIFVVFTIGPARHVPIGETVPHLNAFADSHVSAIGWGLLASNIDTEEALARISVVRNTMLGLVAALLVLAMASSHIVGKQLGATRTRLESERAARKMAEERLAQAFASVPTAMLVIAADGTIVYANRQTENLLGYTTESLQKLSFEQLVPDYVLDGQQQLRAGYTSARRDWDALRSDGHAVPVEINLTPIDTDDDPLVLATFVDLTERNAAETVLEERGNALASSQRELDDFAYIASHDLNAPLRGIDQLATFIIEDAGHLLPERSLADLKLLKGRIGRIKILLSALLEYSGISREKEQPILIETRALILEVAESVLPAARFRVDIADSLPLMFAPPGAMEIVFRNLLLNSVKHHDREQGVIRVDWKRDDSNVHFLISDDGSGIPQQYSEKIFQLFQTLHARDEIEASGMGLAVVKKTMETHGGRVNLVTDEGRDARFQLSWPVHAANLRKSA